MRQRLPAALRSRNFAIFWLVSLGGGHATQMIAVAVGWQVYAIHRHALDLGLIGLLEFAPLPLLALPAGQLADRFPRKLVYAVSLLLTCAIAAGLLVVTLGGASELWPFLVLAAAAGVAGALGNPASRALPPMLVPADLLTGAITIRSIGFQAATIAGPALGGLLFAVRAELVYAVAIGVLAFAFVAALAVRERSSSPLEPQPATVENVLGGLHLIRDTPVLLGAITLDLFAVLFGGAVALLPLFARSVLHTGPTGLGLLRSAPAIGALLAGVALAHRPVGTKTGRSLLLAVGVFGASMVVFGLSKWFAVSAIALAVSGGADMISMNIRSMTIALASPDELRGRVSAVEMVFISASNELGAFESGAAAALVGAVPAVVAGGVLTIALAAVWPLLFPALARMDRLEHLRPRAAPHNVSA